MISRKPPLLIFLCCASTAMLLALMVKSWAGVREARSHRAVAAQQDLSDTTRELSQDDAQEEAWQRHHRASLEWEAKLAALQKPYLEREQRRLLDVAEREQARHEYEEAVREQARQERDQRERAEREKAPRDRVRALPPGVLANQWRPPNDGNDSGVLDRIHGILENARSNTRAYEQQRQRFQAAPSGPVQNFDDTWQRMNRQQELDRQHKIEQRNEFDRIRGVPPRP